MALIKLCFTTHTADSCSFFSEVGRFYVWLNPNSYSRSFSNDWTPMPIAGSAGETLHFNGNSETLSLSELMVDNTLITPFWAFYDVSTYCDDLKDGLQGYYGEEHRPLFTKVTWGTLVFTGVCESVSIDYTLFDTFGSPMRAKVNVQLKKTANRKTVAANAGRSSPDLTHARSVKAGDNLAMMSNQIYKDSSYYLELARINNLNSVFDIKPGDQILFPPIKK
jgi:hypothetical protein